MDREAYGWGVRDIDEGWGGLWIQKDVDSGDIWMGAGDMTFFEQGQGEDQLQKRRCTILFTNYDTSKVTSSQYKIMISM